jgi:hypothetical protein
MQASSAWRVTVGAGVQICPASIARLLGSKVTPAPASCVELGSASMDASSAPDFVTPRLHRVRSWALPRWLGTPLGPKLPASECGCGLCLEGRWDSLRVYDYIIQVDRSALEAGHHQRQAVSTGCQGVEQV